MRDPPELVLPALWQLTQLALIIGITSAENLAETVLHSSIVLVFVLVFSQPEKMKTEIMK